jgi:hypothetical protein
MDALLQFLRYAQQPVLTSATQAAANILDPSFRKGIAAGALMEPTRRMFQFQNPLQYQSGTSDVITDPDDPLLNINTPGQPGYVPPVTTTPILQLRSKFAQELNDPKLRMQLYNLTHREVGGQGPQAQQAFIETLFNRAAARNKTLGETINDRNYFPASSYEPAGYGEKDAARYDQMITNVEKGSNISNYATGNASGNVEFGGGPVTYVANGEKFGREKLDLSAANLTGLPQTEYPTVPLAPAGTSDTYAAPTSAASMPYTETAATEPSKTDKAISSIGGSLSKIGQGYLEAGSKQIEEAASMGRSLLFSSNPYIGGDPEARALAALAAIQGFRQFG